MKSSVLSWIVLFATLGAADPTWPAAIDELEDVMFLSTGYRSRGFSSLVTPCSTGLAAGRNTAAEWLRVGFHDMSTTNVYFTPHGGIDASLAYELNDGENIGAGFASTFITYGGFFNSRLSVSDLVALGVYASVRACGGPVVPIKGGRIDATAAGPLGVPQPQNSIGTFNSQFQRMGFNQTEMIQMTACGHTLGGVHAGNFPQIVAAGTAPNDYQIFDNSLEFDNAIATRYINGPDTDPLSLGISVAATRNSDAAVFKADNNVTLKAMTNAATFNTMCSTILQKMIETVDPAVVLSDVVQPYAVKPTGLQLTLLSGGTLLQFSGDIRVKTTTRSASQVASVQLAYTDRTGAAVATPIIASAGGTASGIDDSFTFYSFSSNLPVTSSISSFTVLINLVSGTTETYNNNGAGYPVSDSVIVQTPQSCLSNGNLTVVAAIRSSVTTPVNMTVTQKVVVTAGSPIPSPLPSLSSGSLLMVPGATFGPYQLYSGSFSIASAVGTKYGVQSGTFSDTFKNPSELGATCQTLGTGPPSSTSTTVSPTSTVSSTSASATPTLGIKQTVGAYTFQGCYTEGDGVRALSGAAFFNYTGMTLELCASDCTGFAYFGVEYGGECYCGNTLGAGSILAAIGDCSFTCPGSSFEYCGAGNRLEMYKLSSLASSTSVSSTSTSSSSSSKLSSSSSTSSPVSTVSTSSSLSSSSVKPSSTSSSSSSSSLVATTTSSSGPTSTPTLHIVQSAGLYNYYGCYTEGNGVRALGAASFPSDTNTVEQCVAACSPYLFAGVEYGRECWCADSFGTGSTLAPDSDCSMTCAGDQYEYCGNGNRLSVYIRNGTFGTQSSSKSVSSSKTSSSSTASTSTSKSVSLSSSSQVSTTSKSVSSSTSSKASTSTSKSVSSSSSSKVSTTTSKSVSSSSSSKVSTSTSKSVSSSSSTKASTSTSKSVTSSVKTSTSTSSSKTGSSTSSKSSSSSTSAISSSTSSSKSSTLSSSTASPTQTAPAIKPTIGAYKYYGCQTEATNVRALSGASSFNYPAMTLESCAASCTGFTYWGVEYGGECYCGNSFGAGSVAAPDSDCSFLCPGDSLEYCGAGNRLSTYVLQ